MYYVVNFENAFFGMFVH